MVMMKTTPTDVLDPPAARAEVRAAEALDGALGALRAGTPPESIEAIFGFEASTLALVAPRLGALREGLARRPSPAFAHALEARVAERAAIRGRARRSPLVWAWPVRRREAGLVLTVAAILAAALFLAAGPTPLRQPLATAAAQTDTATATTPTARQTADPAHQVAAGTPVLVPTTRTVVVAPHPDAGAARRAGATDPPPDATPTSRS
jgi:hypothetical protein